MNKKITIKYASYALADILYDLLNCGITDITITKEDNDLEIVLTREQLAKVKYKKSVGDNNND